MLLGLGHLADLPWVRHGMALVGPGAAVQRPAYRCAALATVSNVPATVALMHRVSDPLWLAVAVNIGGAGLAIGSLANLIALRLEGSRAAWRVFHRVSLPYFAALLGLAWWWLHP